MERATSSHQQKKIAHRPRLSGSGNEDVVSQAFAMRINYRKFDKEENLNIKC